MFPSSGVKIGKTKARLSECTYTHCVFSIQEAGVRRIAVGIGSGIDLRELQQIASANEDVLQVHNYGQLYSKLEEIMKMACEEQYPGKLAKSETKVRNRDMIFD